MRVAVVVGALVLATAGCGGGGGDGGVILPNSDTAATTTTTSGPPTVLAIVSPAAGTEVRGNVVVLDVTSSGITIVAADGSTSGGRGHYHVFVDREPFEPGQIIPVAAGIIHTTEDPIVIRGLHVGPHRISVVYGDGTHRRIGYTEAATSFTVLGPAVAASAPPNVPAEQPVVLTVAVEGLTFPQDGRLYVVVDPDSVGPERFGEGTLSSTDTTIPVTVAPGTHRLRVVAGTADGVPLDPPAMDEVVVTVG